MTWVQVRSVNGNFKTSVFVSRSLVKLEPFLRVHSFPASSDLSFFCFLDHSMKSALLKTQLCESKHEDATDVHITFRL